MPFAVAAAGIGAAGSIASGIMTSNAAGAAAKAQENAANQASAIEQQKYDQTRTDLLPFLTGGTNALSSLQKMLGIGPGGNGASSPLLAMLGIGPDGQPTGAGINPAAFQNSPGYQFQKQQTLDAVTNSAAARGGLGGNALKALQSNASGLANQSWNQYLSNLNTGWQGMVGNLQNLTNLGANAGSNLGTASMNLGTELGGNQQAIGNAQSAGITASNNALVGGIGGALNDIGGYFSGNQNMFSSGSAPGTTVSMPGMGSLTYGSNYIAPPPGYYPGGYGSVPGYGVGGQG